MTVPGPERRTPQPAPGPGAPGSPAGALPRLISSVTELVHGPVDGVIGARQRQGPVGKEEHWRAVAHFPHYTAAADGTARSVRGQVVDRRLDGRQRRGLRIRGGHGAAKQWQQQQHCESPQSRERHGCWRWPFTGKPLLLYVVCGRCSIFPDYRGGSCSE